MSAGREGGLTNHFILCFGSRLSSVVCARSECPFSGASRDPWYAVVSDFCEISRKTFPKPIAILFALWYNSATGDIRHVYPRTLLSTARLKAVRGIVSGAFSKIKVLSKESAFFCPSLTFILCRLKPVPARRAHDRTHGTARHSAIGNLLLDI